MAASRSKPQPRPQPPFDGGCACGQLRYRLLDWPMYVHCCHCTRCQRETGTPCAHHAMVEYTHFSVTAGEAHFVLVPTDSGGKHWVARCPHCQTALWNEHAPKPGKAITRYVRVGTLDAPHALPPLAHIFVRSRQPWVMLDESTPQFSGYYDAAKTWPAASLERYRIAKALRAQEAKASRAVPVRPVMRFSTASERDPAVAAWFDMHTDALGAVARHWFDVLRDSGADVRELLHDDQPTACVDDGAFAYVDAFLAHVNLGFFHGAALPDPAGLLEGTGKFMRHVKLRPGHAIDDTALRALVAAAYADMRHRIGTE